MDRENRAISEEWDQRKIDKELSQILKFMIYQERLANASSSLGSISLHNTTSASIIDDNDRKDIDDQAA